MPYRASSKDDLVYLAQVLAAQPAEKMVAVQSAATANGIMLMPFPFNLMLKFIRWRHGSIADRAFWTKFYNKSPAQFGKFYSDTIRHMLLGKDREETTSVGGFSQRELDIVVTAAGLSQ